MYCRTCGTVLSGASQRSCAICGTALGAPSSPPQAKRTVPTARATFQTARTPSLASGGGCPSCFGGLYANTYTFWYVLLAFLTFPLGLLLFLAPIKRCSCGTSYGVGKAILNFVAIALAVIVAFAIIIAVCVTNAKR
jgi:hypothetical protein